MGHGPQGVGYYKGRAERIGQALRDSLSYLLDLKSKINKLPSGEEGLSLKQKPWPDSIFSPCGQLCGKPCYRTVVW